MALSTSSETSGYDLCALDRPLAVGALQAYSEGAERPPNCFEVPLDFEALSTPIVTKIFDRQKLPLALRSGLGAYWARKWHESC